MRTEAQAIERTAPAAVSCLKGRQFHEGHSRVMGASQGDLKASLEGLRVSKGGLRASHGGLGTSDGGLRDSQGSVRANQGV